MLMELTEGVLKLFPQTARDDQTLKNDFQLKEAGDTVVLTRVDMEPTGDNPEPFYLQSNKIDVVALNREAAAKKRVSMFNRVDEPEVTTTGEE